MNKLFFNFAVIFLLIASPIAVLAQPTPPSHPVKDVERKLKTEKQKAAELKKKVKNIESELTSKKKEILKVSKQIKKNEQDLIILEQRINTKKFEQIEIEERLKKDQSSIADLVLGLERMRRIPPEALIAKPGAPLETAQSAMLLQSILPHMYHRAERLRVDLDKLKIIIEELETNKKKADAAAAKLKKSHTKLTGLMSERKKLYKQTAGDMKRQQAEIKKISLQATNLKDLMAKLEKKQREEDKKRAKKNKTAQATAKTSAPAKRTPIPKAGSPQLPVSGIIKTSYGARDNIGAVSKGLKISSRPGSLVVAPMGGVVEFAGQFKGYGNLIILKHQNQYHSLIAGFEKIDTVVGRAVAAGEPLGYLHKKTSENSAPSLYYELRYKGHPVNPSKKIAGLR